MFQRVKNRSKRVKNFITIEMFSTSILPKTHRSNCGAVIIRFLRSKVIGILWMWLWLCVTRFHVIDGTIWARRDARISTTKIWAKLKVEVLIFVIIFKLEMFRLKFLRKFLRFKKFPSYSCKSYSFLQKCLIVFLSSM